MITLLAVLVLGMPSPDVPTLPSVEPHPDTTSCVFVIPIATPGFMVCPGGVTPPTEGDSQ